MSKVHTPLDSPWHPRQLWSLARLAVLSVVAVLTMTALSYAATIPTVTDRAGLFSNSTVQEANQTIERIYKNTQKQVYIETLASLPAGKQADELAATRFRENNVDGALILIVKDPHKLALTIGRSTEARFRDGEGVRRAMLERFRRDDYDGGLLAGLRIIEPAFTQEFRPGATAPARTAAARGERNSEVAAVPSGISWIWIALLGGGGLLAFMWWRRRRNSAVAGTNYGSSVSAPAPGQMAGGGYQPGVGGVGGIGAGSGGIGRSLLGGAAGAVAGSWLYDRFFRNHDNDAHAASGGGSGASDSSPQDSDHGDVGSTLGGHGDGADWGGGGGDDSAGADW